MKFKAFKYTLFSSGGQVRNLYGGVPERSNGAVSKTVEPFYGSGGSNPSTSAFLHKGFGGDITGLITC